MKDTDFIVALLSGNDVVNKIKAELDRLLTLIPELEDMIGFEHCHPHHHLDVWEHTLLAIEYSENQFASRLALLFHDIGKPHSYRQDGEIRHYRGHAEKSAEITEKIVERLGFDTELSALVTEIVRRHDTPLTEEEITDLPRISRLIFEVQRCDAMAHNPTHNRHRIAYINRMTELINKAEKSREDP